VVTVQHLSTPQHVAVAWILFHFVAMNFDL